MISNIKEIFGKNLRAERERRNISQEKFAEMIDIGIPALSKIENGKSYPKPQTLQRIIDILSIEPEVLFKSKKEIDIESAFDEILKRLKKAKSNEKLFLKIYDKILELTCGLE